ncbi:MAG: DMT family transporter [Saprospiraceae bacterium]|nr:DMT family transporter [Saprospiraceae bacterium]
MWILISCIVLNAFIGVIFKLFDKYKIDNLQAIVINYFVCVATAAAVNGGSPIPHDLTTQPWFYYAFGLGFIFIIVFNLMALTVQNFGVVVATIFQKMSLIAPTMIAIIVYSEPAGIVKWFGILCSILSIILLSYQKSEKTDQKDTSALLWLFPILTFIGSCLIDSALYLIEKQNLAQNGDIGFVASLFLFAGVNGLLILIFQAFRKKVTWQWKNLVGGIALGIPNFFSIYLLLLALQQGWGGSIVFPVNNVGILVVAAIFGLVIFHEKLTKVKIAGFGLAILSIILITMI